MSNGQSGPTGEDSRIVVEDNALRRLALRRLLSLGVPYSFGAIYKHRADDIPLRMVMGGGFWEWWRYRWMWRGKRLRAACARMWAALRA